MQSLTSRIEQLERHCRLWRTGGLGVLILVGFAAICGAIASSKDLETTKLNLVDEEGRQRIQIAADGNTPRITMKDAKGVSRIMMSIGESGVASIGFLDDKGESIRLSLGTAPNGSPAVMVFDSKGKEVFRAPKK